MLSQGSIIKKWKLNTKAATQSYIDGIRGTDVNPMAEAIKAIPQYLAGVQDAVSSGRLQQGLESVSKSQWQDAAEKTGAPRIASGVDKGEAKFNAFWSAFGPEQARITADVRAMDKSSLDARLQRMVEQARRTAALKGIAKRR